MILTHHLGKFPTRGLKFAMKFAQITLKKKGLTSKITNPNDALMGNPVKLTSTIHSLLVCFMPPQNRWPLMIPASLHPKKEGFTNTEIFRSQHAQVMF